MNVEINSRGNGACPICNLSGKCRIQDTITQSVSVFSKCDNPMELVVYSCPQFLEDPKRE